jgi:transcriptional regulator GlxA family with amidase domain
MKHFFKQAAQPPALRLDHLEARLDRDLRELCAAAGCSRSHLGELFRRHLGRPPLRHHSHLRLERAQACGPLRAASS